MHSTTRARTGREGVSHVKGACDVGLRVPHSEPDRQDAAKQGARHEKSHLRKGENQLHKSKSLALAYCTVYSSPT